MKKVILFNVLFILIYLPVAAQYDYEPSNKHPYGLPNPEAPKEISDFAPMIGLCNCKSTTRNQDGSWNETIDMLWTFKYIMNGKAVQDETLKADGTHSGSIREFNSETGKWYVHYYSSSASPKTLPAWEGAKNDNKIVLYREQKAPNGMEGFYRLSFYDITESGYKWIGEWVDKNETIIFPTWKIECSKK